MAGPSSGMQALVSALSHGVPLCRAPPFPRPWPAPSRGPGTRTGQPLPRTASPQRRTPVHGSPPLPPSTYKPSLHSGRPPSHVPTPAGTMTGRHSHPRGRNRTTPPHPRAGSGQPSRGRGSGMSTFFYLRHCYGHRPAPAPLRATVFALALLVFPTAP